MPNQQNSQQPAQRPRRQEAASRRNEKPKQAPPERPARAKQPRRRRIKYHWFRALVMVIAVVIGSGFLAIFMLQSFIDLFGLNQVDQNYDVMIPDNSDLGDVSSMLKELGVIDQSVTFRLYSELKFKEGDSVQPGEYIMNSNMGYDQIILLLKNGVQRQQIVELRFTEGMTLREIANKLEEEGVCESKAFIEYLDSTDFNYEFFNRLPESEHRYHKLEGYLFPDTYQFYVPEKPSSVAKKFLDNFNRKVTSDMQKRMQAINLTLDETITLASIIQKEADQQEYIRRVSSVFHNRLDSGGRYPSLESDVTIFYVENEIKPFIQRTNQPMYDAYNTYVCRGLPVGPICNPGIDAINAALYPAETANYFFVTDVNMDFYFGENLDQHNRNVREAAAVKRITSSSESDSDIDEGAVSSEAQPAQ